MKVSFALLASVLFAPVSLAASPALAADAAHPVIVELFTSQGCSSCPPADAYLSDLTKRKDVLPLAFHVDYWDNLGWKDTFGSSAFTARQYAYAKALNGAGVYTPQMLVNGEHPTVGSRRRDVEAEIKKAATLKTHVLLTQAQTEGKSTITIRADERPKEVATLWLVRYTKAAAVTITRGENAGSTITYRNIVRDIRPLGNWSGNAQTIALPALGDDAYVALLQTGKVGPILAALPLK